jgi:thiamine biosynthesis lipoprotein
MERRRFVHAALGGGGLLALGAVARHCGLWGRPRLRRVTRDFAALGAEMSLVLLHADEQQAHRAAEAVEREVLRVDHAMSLYRAESDLSRLNRHGHVTAPDPYLIEVLRAAAGISRHSGGAFDVTVQPLWQLHAQAAAERREPSSAELERACRRVGWQRVELREDRIRLTGSEMAVTLNGIAQGFAADRAVEVLRRFGIVHALVNAGEVAPLGLKDDSQPWTAGIQHPRHDDAYIAVARLDGRCLATSGDYNTSFRRDYRANHLLDPRTGNSPQHYASVSVLASSATLADGLSTALSMLPPADALRWVRATPGTDALLVLKDGRVLKTTGFTA